MPGARVLCWPGFHWGCKAKVLFIQLSFLCVQFRYNYMCCSVSDSFVFLIINRQDCSCLAWLVFLGGLPEWPFLAHGIGVAAWTVFLLLWMMKAWWSGIPVQCLLHRMPERNMPSVWSPARHNLSSVVSPVFFPLTLCIDHMTQGIVAVGQICVTLDTSQVFIHQTWSKAPAQFQGWIKLSSCPIKATAYQGGKYTSISWREW